jgi:MoxR-like ATPase
VSLVLATHPNTDAAARPALRHRLIPNFEAEGITTDNIIEQILKDVPVTAEAMNA